MLTLFEQMKTSIFGIHFLLFFYHGPNFCFLLLFQDI